MKRIFSILFHSVLFLGLLLAIDQAFVHLPMDVPGLRQSQSFYRDFRSRLLGLSDPILERAKRPPRGTQTSVEGLIEADERRQVTPKAATLGQKGPAGKAGQSPRYLYPDAGGQLQFADSLEEIPEALRSKAQPLGQ